MAKLIPDIDPKTIENNGERAFYTSATSLPDDYTVLYSFKYKDISDGVDGEIRETDFIIVHPALGFLVVEVKQGDIAYIDGAWQELKKNGYQPLHKNPVEQARKAMYSVLDQYKAKANNRPFPLKIRYAVAFPECNKIAGKPPSDLDEKSIFLFGDLDNLENKILDLFAAGEKRQEREAIDLLLNKILAPIFKIFARLEDKIEMHNQRVERTMTEEQERILEETELDDRKIFFGGAGSGKTFLAMEKARRIAKEGKKVLLTCYNRNLANCLFGTIESTYITARNFHDFLEKALGDRVLGLKESLDYETYFARGLPDLGFEYFSTLDEEEKFDAIIVDEGQDFREDWLITLESLLKTHGQFYIFADPNQSLFNKDIEKLKKWSTSKHRLTRNLRNTAEINQWMEAFVPKGHLRPSILGGLPIAYFSWKTPQEEKRLIESQVGRLVSQGVKLQRIVILSPYRKEKSCLGEITKLKEWPLLTVNDGQVNGIRFATIRSFKGLEADVVFLIGLRKNSPVCTDADIYVGGSRAKFLLYVFHEESWKP